MDDGERGFFLVNCVDSSGFTVPSVLSARTGKLLTIPGQGETFFPNADDFDRIGTRWLEGTTAGNGHPTTEYLNWRTGRVKNFGEASGAPEIPRDLDSTSLSALGPRGDFRLFQRDGSVTVSERISSRPAALLLGRGKHRVVLDRCVRDCTSVSLGEGLVSWATGSSAHAYVLRTGKRLAWHFKRAISEANNGLRDGVQGVRGRLYFNVPLGPPPQAGFRVYETGTG